MTQDMKKDTILHKIGQLIVPLKRAMSPLEADSHSACSGHFFNRSLLLLLLMFTVGVGQVWADDVPFDVTTNPSAPHYYLLQNVGTSSFYAMPYDDIDGDEIRITTTNVPNSDMRFYFMSVEGDEGYYYIIHCSGKYLYAKGSANADGGARLKESSTLPTDARYKFSIEQNGDGYYIKNKYIENNTASNKLPVPLCKRGGNTGIGYKDNKNPDYYFLKWNTYRPIDDFFRWNFIPISDTNPITWTAPFTPSTEDNYHYYKIKNSVNTSSYISGNTSTNVKTSSTAEIDDITWIFKEVPAGENGSDKYITYYYIIHAFTGEYMCFDGEPSEYAQNQEDAIILQPKTETNEQKCQFIIIRSSQRDATTLYNIIPKVLKDDYWDKQSIGQKDNTDGTNVWTATDREDDTNTARWVFEQATGYPAPCADPVITCDADGVVCMTCTEDGAAIHYTIADGLTVPDDPTGTDALSTTFSNPITSTKTIKAIAVKGPHVSSVVTQTIVYVLNQTFESSTYDGTDKTPVVKVGEATISSDEYTVTYEKAGVVVTEHKDAGTYAVTITDKADGDYIVYGTGSFTIGQKNLTISADSDEKEYDGTALIKNSYTNTVLADGDSFESVTVTGSQTVRGTSNNVPSNAVIKNGSDVNVTSNYNITYTNGTLTVSPKEVSLNWSNSPLVYNGNDQVPTATVSNLIEGDECTVTVTVEGEHTNVGNYTATATALSNTNYKLPASATTTFEITKRPVTVSGITANNKPYDGTKDAELVSTGATFGEGDIISGDNLTFTSATGEFTDKNVGIGKTVNIISWTLGGDDAGNYEGALSGTITADITPLEAILSWSSDLTYDGTPQVPTATISNLIEGDNCTVTVTVEGEHTNAGNYTAAAMSFAESDAGNYSIPTANTYNFTISPKTVGLTWDETSYTYDGQSHAPVATATEIVSIDEDDVGVSVTISEQEGSSLTEGNAINHGNYTATAALTGEKAGNYALPASPMQAFTIGKKNIGNGTSVPASDITYTLEKDGNDFVITVKHGENVLSAKESDGDTDYDYALNTAGTTSKYFVATVSGGNNYDGSFIVKYAHVTFTTDDNEADYYATFVADGGDYSTNGHTLPEGVTAYIVESIEDDEVKTVQLDYMPTGVPVLLMSATNVDGFHVKEVDEGDVYTEAEIAEKRIADNMLKEVTDDPSKHFDVATIYLLYKNEFVLNKAGNLGKGKIYLDPTSSGASPARLKISRGGSAGIENIEYTIDSKSGAWYTLDGRRLSSKPTKKGIYLQSGKKIVVK